MKNRKAIKSLIFCAVSLCLVWVMLAFVSSAAGKPVIISENVMYTDKFSLVYAVDASTVSGGSATLRVAKNEFDERAAYFRDGSTEDSSSIDITIKRA